MIARNPEKKSATARMVELYREGKSLKQVGEIMNCSYRTVQYRLEQINEPRRSKGRPRTAAPRPPAIYERTRARVRRVRELKSLGWKQAAIASELGISQGRVSQMLGEAPQPKPTTLTEPKRDQSPNRPTSAPSA